MPMIEIYMLYIQMEIYMLYMTEIYMLYIQEIKKT